MFNCKKLIGLELEDAIWEIVVENTCLYKIVQLDNKYFSEDLQKSLLDKVYLKVKNHIVIEAYYHNQEDVIDIDEDIILVKEISDESF